MDILSLTTTQAVRAVLGIAEDTTELPVGELPDSAFTALGISDLLSLQLEGWLPISIAEATALTGSALSALKACALYNCALIMLPSLRHGAATKYSDGQNELQRQPRDFEALRADLEAELGQYRALFMASYGASVALGTSFFGVARPVYDPVTG